MSVLAPKDRLVLGGNAENNSVKYSGRKYSTLSERTEDGQIISGEIKKISINGLFLVLGVYFVILLFFVFGFYKALWIVLLPIAFLIILPAFYYPQKALRKYHGAEHKVHNAYINSKVITLENVSRKQFLINYGRTCMK